MWLHGKAKFNCNAVFQSTLICLGSSGGPSLRCAASDGQMPGDADFPQHRIEIARRSVWLVYILQNIGFKAQYALVSG